MNIDDLKMAINSNELGKEMYKLVCDLYPICRSITGNGFRETLDIIKGHIPLEVHEVSSGTQVFDWTVPKEWNISDAYIKNSKGDKIIDFNKSNLHVLNYSIPIKKTISLVELKKHLFTIPEHPDWIPYRTSYYNENWGFCLSHNQFAEMQDDEYEVCIDSSLKDGNLTYGEYLIKGEIPDEILISCHACHPSLCNDNLSGVSLVTFLAKHLRQLSLRYSYRFLYIPGTIGAITWLNQNKDYVNKIRHGLIAVCVGDSGPFTYKKSRQGEAEVDQAVAHVLKWSEKKFTIINFFPYGYDERQFCSPGFNLPVGCLMRTPHGQYPEYHTSADDINFVQPGYLSDSLLIYLLVLQVLEYNKKYLNQNPHCEPQLGKRGLYPSKVNNVDNNINQLALLWVLNLSDGHHSLLDIATRSQFDFFQIYRAAKALFEHQLLVKC